MAVDKGVLACAEWLKYCLSIGWSKSSLDELQALWWRYHDKDGNLIEIEIGADRERT